MPDGRITADKVDALATVRRPRADLLVIATPGGLEQMFGQAGHHIGRGPTGSRSARTCWPKPPSSPGNLVIGPPR